MLREEPKAYNQIDFDDWYNDRLEEKVGKPCNFPGDLDDLKNRYKLVAEEDYNKIVTYLKYAFDKAREMNYKILTKRLDDDLKRSPDPDEKVKMDKEDAQKLLKNFGDAYRDFLSGNLVIRPFEGSCFQYVKNQYSRFEKAKSSEKKNFNVIINISSSHPYILIDGSIEPNPLHTSLTATPDKQNAILLVASCYDLKKYLEDITKTNDNTYDAGTCALILYYLQEKYPSEFTPGSHRKHLESQLTELGLLYTNYNNTYNAGNVRNKLSEIRKETYNNAMTKPQKLEQAIKFLSKRGYDEAKKEATGDYEKLKRQ